MRIKRYKAGKGLVIIYLLLLPFLAGFAGDGIYNYDAISLKDGLSQSTVNTILQDKYGFIWFGTENGLNRYDGYDFVHFFPDKSDTTSISNNIIHSIIEDKGGCLWIGTEYGLNRYDQRSGIFSRYIHSKDDTTSISGNNINAIFHDSDNDIWVGTLGEGLNLFDRKTNSFQHFKNNRSVGSNIIYSIIEDNRHKNILWVGTENGLFKFDRNQKKFLYSNDDTSQYDQRVRTIYSIRSIVQDSTGTLYIGTWHGLIKYSTENDHWSRLNMSNTADSLIKYSIILSLLIDDKNTIWVGTRDNGLLSTKINHTGNKIKNHWQQYDEFKDDVITSLYHDKSGMLWIGTTYHGINKLSLSNKKFMHYDKNSFNGNGLSNNVVLSVITDPQKNIWVGTKNGGLNKIDRKHAKITHYKAKQGATNWLNNNNILCFSITTSQNTDYLWIGTNGGGLNKLNLSTDKFEVFTSERLKDTGLSNNNIYSITPYDEDHLIIGYWLVLNYGIIDIFNIRTNKVVSYNINKKNSKGPANNIVMNIYKDRSGIVWLGTRGSGLVKFVVKNINAQNPSDIGTITNYIHDPDNPGSISHNNVYSIYEDRNGIFWIGTGGGGLEQFDRMNETFHHFTMEDGLPDNIIYGIIEDENNNLWLSTANGLCLFNPKTEKFTVYDKRDGLLDNVFNSGAYNIAPDNEIFFGGTNGLTAFYADSIRNDTYDPEIVITKFTISSRETSYDYRKFSRFTLASLHNINLTHQFNNLLFEFSALDYSNSDKNKYSYILEGYDSKWINTDASRRFANYTNLSPGKYVFKVKGTNSDGLWSNRIASIEVTVEPPYWLKWWFVTLALAVLLVLAAYYYIRWRKKQLLEKNELEKWAEKSIARERNQLRTLIDNMPDVIYIKDRESRFTAANKKVAEVMNAKSPAELIGKKDSDYYPPDLAMEFYTDEQEIMKTGIPIIGKAEPGQDEKGNKRIISTTKVPLKNKEGEIIGIIGIGRDITKMKNTEKELRKKSEILQETNVLLEERQEEIQQQSEELQSQAENLLKMNGELERLNLTKDKFFSIIAHDLKNPFHAIIGFSEMLVNDFKDMDDQQKLGLIELINMSSESAYNLLENLLQWARTQTDKIKFVPKKIDISKIVQSVFKLHKISADKKRIRLENHVKEFKYVFADENMIHTVIRNLVSNAIKFTNNNGIIEITTTETDGKIKIAITDNGVGINEDSLEKLFRIDSYYSTAGTSGEAGTGLGLIICQEFIKKNGGKLQAESVLGKGSTFTFSLPKSE